MEYNDIIKIVNIQILALNIHNGILPEYTTNYRIFGFVSKTSGFADTSLLAKKHISGWWFQHFLFFPYIGNFIIPTDFHVFRGVETTNQIDR
jgi:hypothetical protein